MFVRDSRMSQRGGRGDNTTQGSGDGKRRSDRLRAGRMLTLGDLRLIALSLIAQQPRHGYEIIKNLEEKTAGWYSPSPGIVYPTLAHLEEMGYVTARDEGAKKLHTITAEGRAHLDQNRHFVDPVLERVAAISERMAAVRDQLDDDDIDIPPLVRAAIDNLRVVAAKRLEDDAEVEARLVAVLARVASELKKA
jgi:DNA-binding PadR family transcriptional regulator